MLNKLKKNNSGFTIIEVLIVLAIAGLILLVVFLAVPALQRNQRNQGYRSEANRLLASAQEVSANNGGDILTNSTCVGNPSPATAISCNNTATPVNQAMKVWQASNSKNVTDVAIQPVPTTATTTASKVATTPATLTSVTLVTSAKCDTANQGQVFKGTTRQTVLLYAVEDNAGIVVPQCQES